MQDPASGSGGGTPPKPGEGTPGAGTGSGGGQGTDVTAKLDAIEQKMVELQRDKLQLEKDLNKERAEKAKKDAEAKAATEKAASAQKAALDALRAAGIEIPGQDPAAEVAAKLKVIEDEKRKAAEEERESKIARLTIERELLKALAGKADDPEYALYRAVRTAAFADVKVDGDKVSGIEAVIEELAKAGVLKTDKGKEPGRPPGSSGQPPLQGDKWPWREAKDWTSFLKLPWATQEEAKKTDPDFVRNLEAAHFRK